MALICVDIEASGLGVESYPIEIAWKNDATGEYDSFLINPETALDWVYWDDYAEEMHGLEREGLIENGIDIVAACKRLNDKLDGQTLVSDAVEFDQFWMTRLFDATDIRPSFRMAGLNSVLSKAQTRQFALVAKVQSRKHRALDDVEDILTCIHSATRSVT